MTVPDEHEHPDESRHQQKGGLHETTGRENEDSAAGVCKCLWFLDSFVSFWQQRHKWEVSWVGSVMILFSKVA